MADIFGTIFNDNLLGTIFDDFIFADDGNDTVNGGNGNDIVDGGNGDDSLNGGNGDDILNGGNGDDTLNGGNGDDILNGGNGNDILNGSDDDDSLNGGNGNDTVNGGNGNDIVDGGIGNDIVNGGNGDDTLIGTIIGNDTLNGGTGTDTADYSALGSAITLESQGVVNKGTTTLITTFGPVTVSNGVDQIQNIQIIKGAIGQANKIDGSTGTGPTSFDVDLSSNSLTVNGIPGLGNVNFTVENFVNVTGTDFGDQIKGNSQANVLNGDAGNDVLIGTTGNDTLNGGTGTDIADYSGLGTAITLESQGVVNKGITTSGLVAVINGVDQIQNIEIIQGAIGQANTIDGSTGNGPTSFDVDLSSNSLTVNGIPGLGNVNFTVENFVNVTGTDANDNIRGNSQANVLNGDAADDFIFGDDGNDTINGGSGNDTLLGEQDNDVLIGTIIGNDTLNGGTGTDTADYSALGSAITLESQGVVNKGTTTLITTFGPVAVSNGVDQIQNIEIIKGAIGQANKIDGSTGTGPTSFDVDLSTNSLTVNGIPGLGNVNFTVENFVNVTGTDSGDSLTGDSQDNILEGGLGDDTLTGGLGADVFVFNSLLEGIDVIEDFETGEGDRIEVSGYGFGATSTNQFNFDFGTGALSFLGTQFAQLNNIQSPVDFIPSLNIDIV